MLSPRAHNTISYAGALAAYAAAAWLYATPRDDAGVGGLAGVVGLVLWAVHFARRTLESLFLFRFGAAKVSAADSAVEFAYYWLFGFFIARQLALAASEQPSPVVLFTGVLVWVAAEYGNFMCHLSLRTLKDRSAGQPQDARSFPPATLPFLFNLVACPHYTFEIVSWAGFNLATGFTLPGRWLGLAAMIDFPASSS
jgi:very-long-chain enoyl-CoA reductase